MAKVIVDDALLREPNLWIPGKKPVGEVKVDWNNPWSKRLIAAYTFRINDRRDLVNGDLITKDTAEFVPKGFDVGTNDFPSIITPPRMSQSNGWIAFGFIGNGTPDTYGRYLRSSSGGFEVRLNNSQTKSSVVINGSTVNFVGTPNLWADNKEHHILVGWDSSVPGRWFVVDGVNFSTGVSFTPTTMDATMVVGNLASGTNRPIAGIFTYMYFFSDFSAVTDSFETTFRYNPHEILIPA